MYTLDDLDCMRAYRKNDRPYPKVRRKIPAIRRNIDYFEGTSEDRKEFVNDMLCMHFLFREMEKSGELDASYLGPDLEIFVELVDKYWREAAQMKWDSYKRLTGRKLTHESTANMFDNVPSSFLFGRKRGKFISFSRFGDEGYGSDLFHDIDFMPIIPPDFFNSSIKRDIVINV